jgi:IS5 family transposase
VPLRRPPRCAPQPSHRLEGPSIRADIEQYCGLGAQVIDQARRCVLNGEQVPTAEKIHSIFEPHTDLIKSGEVRTPVEFGDKVFLAESATGFDHSVRSAQGESCGRSPGNIQLQRQRRVFCRGPKVYSADRFGWTHCGG